LYIMKRQQKNNVTVTQMTDYYPKFAINSDSHGGIREIYIQRQIGKKPHKVFFWLVLLESFLNFIYCITYLHTIHFCQIYLNMYLNYFFMNLNYFFTNLNYFFLHVFK